jgi:hypothetical protein
MRSASGAIRDARKAIEASGVRRDNDPSPSDRGGGDEVVRAPRLPGPAHVRKQLAVAASDVEVIVLDRQGFDDGIHEHLYLPLELDLHPQPLKDREEPVHNCYRV